MISSIHIIISTILVFLSFSSAQNQTQLQIINPTTTSDGTTVLLQGSTVMFSFGGDDGPWDFSVIDFVNTGSGMQSANLTLLNNTTENQYSYVVNENTGVILTFLLQGQSSSSSTANLTVVNTAGLAGLPTSSVTITTTTSSSMDTAMTTGTVVVGATSPGSTSAGDRGFVIYIGWFVAVLLGMMML